MVIRNRKTIKDGVITVSRRQTNDCTVKTYYYFIRHISVVIVYVFPFFFNSFVFAIISQNSFYYLCVSHERTFHLDESSFYTDPKISIKTIVFLFNSQCHPSRTRLYWPFGMISLSSSIHINLIFFFNIKSSLVQYSPILMTYNQMIRYDWAKICLHKWKKKKFNTFTLLRCTQQ